MICLAFTDFTLAEAFDEVAAAGAVAMELRMTLGRAMILRVVEVVTGLVEKNGFESWVGAKAMFGRRGVVCQSEWNR